MKIEKHISASLWLALSNVASEQLKVSKAPFGRSRALAASRRKYAMHKLSMSANMKKAEMTWLFWQSTNCIIRCQTVGMQCKIPKEFFFLRGARQDKDMNLVPRRNFHISNHKLIRVRAQTHNHTKKASLDTLFGFFKVWSM